jgi:hypothetical protein
MPAWVLAAFAAAAAFVPVGVYFTMSFIGGTPLAVMAPEQRSTLGLGHC